MTRFQTTLLILALTLGAAFASRQALKDRPLTFFLLGGDPPEAFRVTASLANGETFLEPIPMDRNSSQKAHQLMDLRDAGGLRKMADELGRFQGVLGVQGSDWEGALSWYLGGGIAQVFRDRPQGSFDDLGVLDRAFLTILLRPPGTPPLQARPIEVDVPVQVRSALTPLPSPSSIAMAPAEPLRVEIQNGCGIKGAADWVARRMKSPQLVVIGTGNAPNFRYPKTRILTTAGVPVALEDALDRLGFPRGSVEEVPTLSEVMTESVWRVWKASDVNVVVIVGRDFKVLKAKVQ